MSTNDLFSEEIKQFKLLDKKIKSIKSKDERLHVAISKSEFRVRTREEIEADKERVKREIKAGKALKDIKSGKTELEHYNNQILSGLNKGLKVSKYDLFRLEIISYPVGKFSLRLKQIHEELFTPVNFEKLLADLEIIWSWRFNSTHYAAYKILQSLPEKDIA